MIIIITIIIIVITITTIIIMIIIIIYNTYFGLEGEKRGGASRDELRTGPNRT